MHRHHGYRISKVLFIGLIAVTMGAPVLIGAVHPLTQVVLGSSVLLLTALAVVYWQRQGKSMPASVTFWILAALAAWIALSALPWPVFLRSTIDPNGYGILQIVTEGLEGNVGRSLAWDLPESSLRLLHHLSCACVVLLAAGICRERNRAWLLLWTLNIALLGLAFLSAVHLFTRADRIWWTYQPDWWEGFMAPFVNQNHAAALFLASTCLHVGLCFTLPNTRKRWVLMPLAVLPAFLVLQSHSRSAFVGLFLGMAFFFIMLWRMKRLSTKSFWQWALLSALILAALLPSVGMVRSTFGRRDTTTLTSNQKVLAWRDTLGIVRSHPVTGVGRGSFQVAFTRYKRFHGKVTVTHAENLPLQIAAEMGLLVFLSVLLVTVFAVIRFFKTSRLKVIDCTVLGCLVGLFVQNMADFNLEFPGTAFLTMVLLGFLTGRRMDRRAGEQRPHHRGSHRSLTTYVLSWIVLAFTALSIAWASLIGVPHNLKTDTRALERSYRDTNPHRALFSVQESLKRHPLDYYHHLVLGLVQTRFKIGSPLRWLNNALFLNPSDPRPHLVTAFVLDEMGAPDQAALEYRSAFRRGAVLSNKLLVRLTALSERIRRATNDHIENCLLAWQLSGLSAAVSFPELYYLVLDGKLRLDRRYTGEVLTWPLPSSPSDWLRLARLLENNRRLSDGLSVVDLLSDHWPSDSKGLETLTRLLKKADLPIEALGAARRLIDVSTSEEAFRVAADIVAWAEGNAKAMTLLDRGIHLNPGSIELSVMAAELAIEEKDNKLARRIILRRFQHGGFSLKERQRLLRVLMKIAQRTGAHQEVKRIERRIKELGGWDDSSRTAPRKP